MLDSDDQRVIIVRVGVQGIFFGENNVDPNPSYGIFRTTGGYDVRVKHLPYVSSSSNPKEAPHRNTSSNGVRYMVRDPVSHLQEENGDERVIIEDMTQVSFVEIHGGRQCTVQKVQVACVPPSREADALVGILQI